MRNRHQIQEEVEKTLQAFDHDLPLEPNPFLFTKIQAERAGRTSDRARDLAWHVRFRYVVIAGILLVNLITVFHYVDRSAKLSSQEALVSALEREFSVGDVADEF